MKFPEQHPWLTRLQLDELERAQAWQELLELERRALLRVLWRRFVRECYEQSNAELLEAARLLQRLRSRVELELDGDGLALEQLEQLKLLVKPAAAPLNRRDRRAARARARALKGHR